MTVEYIRYRLSAEQQPAFLDAIRAANIMLAASPDCLRYELTQCQEDATRFIWRIEWTSVERHLQGFRKSAEFGAFFQLVKPFYAGIEEMQHYAVVE